MRNGSYPPPPYYPPRLSLPDMLDVIQPRAAAVDLHLCETDAVYHAYIGDDWPGPTVLFFRDDTYIGYDASITIDRVAAKAERFLRDGLTAESRCGFYPRTVPGDVGASVPRATVPAKPRSPGSPCWSAAPIAGVKR